MSAIDDRAIKVMLVDDHEVVRCGLRMIIGRHPALMIVGEAATRDAALELARSEQPDVVLLDLMLGDENGAELIPDLRQAAPDTRVLVLTGVRDHAAHQQAVRLGAVGLVLKEHSATVLVSAIEHVVAGQAWLDAGLVAGVLGELSRANGAKNDDPEAAKIASLTERERAVITLICEGLQNKAIARRLAISDTTVRHHLTSIFAKLELEHRLELVIYAYRNGLAAMPE